MTPKEFALLRILLEHRGEVLSSDEDIERYLGS